MIEPRAIYFIDTCSLTTLQRVYPRDVFPGAWELLETNIEEENVASVEDVFEELKVQDDELLRWAKDHSKFFFPLSDAIQIRASSLLAKHPQLIDVKRRKSSADPFLIATALENSGKVVTEEKKSNSPKRLMIPDVCDIYKIDCINLLELLRREGLKLK